MLGILLQQNILIPGHAAASRVMLSQDSQPFVQNSKLLSPTSGSQNLTFAVGLNVHNQSKLEQYAKDVSNPKSPLYRHYLDAGAYNNQFAPTAEDESSVVDFLKSQGFTIDQTFSNHLLVVASGSVDKVQQSFKTQINNYQTLKGRRFYANASAPSVPTGVANKIQTISGLDNYTEYKHSPMRPAVKHQTTKGGAAATCPTGGKQLDNTFGYVPSQIAKAYNLTELYAQGFHGEGQSVGLIELSDYNHNDISTFTKCFGGSGTKIQNIYVTPASKIGKDDAGEVVLDMDMVLGLAPKLDNLKVYMTANDHNASTTSWNAVWNKAISDRVPVISVSWGSCESNDNAENSQAKLENTYFQTATVQGQTVLASAGDDGSTDCTDDNNKIIDKLSVDDPAAQPFVTGVGGTQLFLNTDNTINVERVWNEKDRKDAQGKLIPEAGATGGGKSIRWPRPTWQQAQGITSANRQVPDVALNADTLTGYYNYCTSDDCQNAGWNVGAGTSAAAPGWAAIVALTNQSMKAAGEDFPVGFLNPLLYTIANDPAANAAVFHDIVKTEVQPAGFSPDPRSNDLLGTHNGTYPVTPGYDSATGLGTVDASNFAGQIVKMSKPQ